MTLMISPRSSLLGPTTHYMTSPRRANSVGRPSPTYQPCPIIRPPPSEFCCVKPPAKDGCASPSTTVFLPTGTPSAASSASVMESPWYPAPATERAHADAHVHSWPRASSCGPSSGAQPGTGNLCFPNERAKLRTHVLAEKAQATAGLPQTCCQYWNREPEGPRDTKGLRVISLGSYCGVRQSIKGAGYDDMSLPFDWIRTRVDGILLYLRNDFQGFLDFTTRHEIPGRVAGVPTTVTYKDYYHSFWHDDPTNPQEQDKYRRRILRLMNMRKQSLQSLLFVRSMNESAELAQTGDLLEELMRQFGSSIKLLLIADLQTTHSGPVLLSSHPNLMVYFVTPDTHTKSPDGAPFIEPIRCAAAWAHGERVHAPCIPGIAALTQLTSYYAGPIAQGVEPFDAQPGFAGNLITRTPPNSHGPKAEGFETFDLRPDLTGSFVGLKPPRFSAPAPRHGSGPAFASTCVRAPPSIIHNNWSSSGFMWHPPTPKTVFLAPALAGAAFRAKA